MEMDTYMQTAQSTQRTEVLVLEMKHYERLLAKRNPKTIHNMKMELAFRLNVLGHGQHRQMALLKTLQVRVDVKELSQGKRTKFDRFVDLNVRGAKRRVYSDLRIYRN